MKTVSAECLLRGSLHALDHCSALLRDAVVLLRARRYSTAAALALLGREELGRHRILLGMWRAVATGGPDPTVEQVNNACGEDHVDKQREAQLSVMTRATPGTQVHQLVETVYFADATEAEKIAARERLDLIHERRKRRLPHERHQMRMRAFYVDLLEDGTWSRPSDLPADDCYFAVWDAYSDYLPARDRIGEPLVHEDQLLLSALDALPGGAPEFPPFIDIAFDVVLDDTCEPPHDGSTS
jgi:AbiV family abortive infection protein